LRTTGRERAFQDEAHLEHKEYVVLLKDRFFIANRAETG